MIDFGLTLGLTHGLTGGENLPKNG
jgi:hypothetical protein